mmetsp:Transcript_53994/g.101407  ORF Transcript_53994/g.101407 Transcript_53994/m.101407 type:complete len:216 (-) Transcript_53994:733-1380(-)
MRLPLNEFCKFVFLYILLSTTRGSESRLISKTIRMPSMDDSSRISAIPSSFFSLTIAAIRSSMLFFDTPYGSCVTTTASRLPDRAGGSTCASARMTVEPLPVKYICLAPDLPMMIPPVGKSGAGTSLKSSSSGRSRSSSSARSASTISPKLCGGQLVAMPTAMPVAPFNSSIGNRAGRTIGSTSEPSKLSPKSTTSSLTSDSSASAATGVNLHSV